MINCSEYTLTRPPHCPRKCSLTETLQTPLDKSLGQSLLLTVVTTVLVLFVSFPAQSQDTTLRVIGDAAGCVVDINRWEHKIRLQSGCGGGYHYLYVAESSPPPQKPLRRRVDIHALAQELRMTLKEIDVIIGVLVERGELIKTDDGSYVWAGDGNQSAPSKDEERRSWLYGAFYRPYDCQIVNVPEHWQNVEVCFSRIRHGCHGNYELRSSTGARRC